MGFHFGRQSLLHLKGVHPDLSALMKRAIKITAIDFKITQGLRTVTQQKAYVAAGKSKTMTSRHLTGHAVDVVAIVNGNVSWNFPLYAEIARAVRIAAIEMNMPVEWGAVWDRRLNLLGENLLSEVTDYRLRQKLHGNDFPLIDGPHFQLSRTAYP